MGFGGAYEEIVYCCCNYGLIGVVSVGEYAGVVFKLGESVLGEEVAYPVAKDFSSLFCAIEISFQFPYSFGVYEGTVEFWVLLNVNWF